MIRHCSFDLHFSNNGQCWASFYVFVSHLYFFFAQIIYLDILPTFWLYCFFSRYWAEWAMCIIWRLTLHLLLFSSIHRNVFSPYTFLHCAKAFTFQFRALEKEMATHSGVLAWRIRGMGEPGGLPSLGSHRVAQSRTQLKRLSSIRFVLISITPGGGS